MDFEISKCFTQSLLYKRDAWNIRLFEKTTTTISCTSQFISTERELLLGDATSKSHKKVKEFEIIPICLFVFRILP